MPKKPGVRIANLRRFIISLIILLALVIFVGGIIFFLSTRDNLDTEFSPAFITDDSEYRLLDDFYIVLEGDLLSRYAYSGELLWSKGMYTDTLALDSSEKLITVYSNKSFQALTTEGEYLYSTDVIGTISRIECGNSVIAVFSEIIEEDGRHENMVYFYNAAGSLFDSISFYPQNIIDFGFTQADTLWVLTNDPTNVIPVSRIITYKPGVSMTGLTNLYSELADKVYFSGDNMYVVSTANLLQYDLFGQQLSANLIYDWQVKTADLSLTGDYFVAVPRSQNKDKYYSSARILSATEAYTLNLPKSIDDLLMLNSKLYVFGGDTIYIYSEKGEYLRQYKLSESITFKQLASDKNVLVTFKKAYYFLALP